VSLYLRSSPLRRGLPEADDGEAAEIPSGGLRVQNVRGRVSIGSLRRRRTLGGDETSFRSLEASSVGSRAFGKRRERRVELTARSKAVIRTEIPDHRKPPCPIQSCVGPGRSEDRHLKRNGYTMINLYLE